MDEDTVQQKLNPAGYNENQDRLQKLRDAGFNVGSLNSDLRERLQKFSGSDDIDDLLDQRLARQDDYLVQNEALRTEQKEESKGIMDQFRVNRVANAIQQVNIKKREADAA